MNVIMTKSFDALEAALSQLVESISSYSPSPAAASAVVLADTGIAESLELRTGHLNDEFTGTKADKGGSG